MKHVLLFLYRSRGQMIAAGAPIGFVLLGCLLIGVVAPIVTVLTFIALGVLVIALLVSCIGPRCVPVQQQVVVAPPVEGRWLALNSPASKVPSHGVYMYGQTYAIGSCVRTLR